MFLFISFSSMCLKLCSIHKTAFQKHLDGLRQFLFSHQRTRLWFLFRLVHFHHLLSGFRWTHSRLEKPPSASPLTRTRGEGKAKSEFWEFVHGINRKLTENKKTKATLNFCDSRPLAGAKVDLQGWPWRKDNCHYASGRTPKTVHDLCLGN